MTASLHVVRNVVERRSDSTERRARTEIHSGRESRLFNAGYEARSDEGEVSLRVRGYASVTGEPYPVRDYLGEYHETIARGAFAKTLAEADVRLLLNHDGLPLARTKSGTLKLTEDGTGLDTDALLDHRSTLAKDLWYAIDRGDLDQMSFQFRATRQEWNADYTERTIRELELFDVSAVTFPANPATSISARDARASLAPASRRALRLRAAAAAIR